MKLKAGKSRSEDQAHSEYTVRLNGCMKLTRFMNMAAMGLAVLQDCNAADHAA